MVIAITPQARREYVLKAERDLPEEARTVFLFRTVPFNLRLELGLRGDQVTRDPEAQTRTMTQALRFCLVGWRNFKDAGGADVPFRTEQADLAGQFYLVPTSETLDRLPDQDRVELCEAAMAGLYLEKDDVRG